MRGREDVLNLLRRVFKAGVMQRLPRKRSDADVLLALSVSSLEAEAFYDESEINDHLSTWLDGISSVGAAADYVTLRRALVDHGFLRRATDGVIYRLVPERISENLSLAAQALDPKQVFAEVDAQRRSRRRSFGKT